MEDPKDPRIIAFVTTFFSLVGFILALFLWREEEYVMFYAKQSLIIFIVSIVAGILTNLLSLIPFAGGIINSVIGIAIFALWLMSWIYALSGQKKDVPIIGILARKIKL